jgi:hypothetical protein
MVISAHRSKIKNTVNDGANLARAGTLHHASARPRGLELPSDLWRLTVSPLRSDRLFLVHESR